MSGGDPVPTLLDSNPSEDSYESQLVKMIRSLKDLEDSLKSQRRGLESDLRRLRASRLDETIASAELAESTENLSKYVK